MLTKEITLCGKQVTLAYCYATEIAYKDMSDENIADYIKEAVACIQQKTDPDVKKTIYAILACMLAYYQSRGEDAPLKDTDLMSETTPAELGTAIFTIIGLRMDFYHVPKGEPEDKATTTDGSPSGKEDGSKN
jgi:hypothetical protein